MRTFPERILGTMAVTSRTLWARLRNRLQFFTQPAALPLVLLLLALSTVFLFGHDRGHFYRYGHHEWLTSQHLALAANLSSEHNFLMFISRTLSVDGEPLYETYARWPIGLPVLGKLAMLPFWDDLSARIYAVRIVMLLLFSGSALLAYGSLVRLIADRWIALTATLVPFSSSYSLYYNDIFAPDVGAGLFGLLLTFQGMVVYAQEGRFRQLLVKACVALLLCWNVYGLLLPFIALGLIGELVKTRHDVSASSRTRQQIKLYGESLLTSRYLTLGVASLFFGLSLLSFNVASVYFAFDGEIALTELPLIESLIYRFGASPELDATLSKHLAYPNFLKAEFYRISQMLLPFILSPYDEMGQVIYTKNFLVFFGASVVGLCIIGIIISTDSTDRLLLVSFVISGFCWTLPLRRYAAFHDFTSLFYIGIPLTSICLMMLYIKKLSNPQLVSTFAVAALCSFILSSAKMAGVGHDRNPARVEAEMLKDFETIRNVVDEGMVFIPSDLVPSEYAGAPMAAQYFLSGVTMESRRPLFMPKQIRERLQGRRSPADYLILRQREESSALLTPDNRHFFLYDRWLLDDLFDSKMSSNPIIVGDYEVYLSGDTLTYVSDACTNSDTPFFLHIIPSDVADLPENRKRHGFENWDFHFVDHAPEGEPRCITTRKLPKYDIAAIRTGQYTAEGRLWEATYHVK